MVFVIRKTSSDKVAINRVETNTETQVSYSTHFTMVDNITVAEEVVKALNKIHGGTL